ncbi:helix-turn-helix domain-containing protein [Paenibacillus sp. FSL K6-2859]|jgi:excisionase family DNA binding protein|uniref:helix-turn-helix domain-containing protein n=1 Tax=Paenibacillus sp. FSL K6-2859 TaxID=2921482 RepID=UPI0030FAB90F
MDTTINRLLTIDEARAILRVGRNTMYSLTKQAGFPVIKLQKQIRIPHNALITWVEKQLQIN